VSKEFKIVLGDVKRLTLLPSDATKLINRQFIRQRSATSEGWACTRVHAICTLPCCHSFNYLTVCKDVVTTAPNGDMCRTEFPTLHCNNFNCNMR
jgi:hypothetical protein